MDITRRRALALTATSLVAVVASPSISDTVSASAVSARVAAALTGYHSAVAAYATVAEAQEAMEASPACPPLPTWKATGHAAADLGHRVEFHSVTDAQEFCDALIAKHRAYRAPYTDEEWGGDGLVNTHEAYLARIAHHRDEAVAILRRMEAAYAPLARLEEATGEACDRCFAALDALLEAPCVTLEDIRVKSAAMLEARCAFGGQLEYGESEALLRSFMTAGGVS